MKIVIILGLIGWYVLNYSACMAEHNTWPHGYSYRLDDPQHMARERAMCGAFSLALPVIPIVTGGYWALRHNGWAW